MRPRGLPIGDQRILGLIIAPLWLAGCSSRTEVDVLQWWLHNGAGEPVLTMIAAEVCVTDHDRGPSTSFEAIALRSFRGAGLTPSPSAIELPPRHGSPFETPIVVPFMRATADTVNAEGGARGPLVLFSPDERFDSVVLKPLLWDHSLGSAPPPKDVADIVSSVSGAIARTQPRQVSGTGTSGEILVGWAPDVGQRFTFAFPPPLNPPTSCPEGYTDLTAGAVGRMNMSPGGRFLAYTSGGGAVCNHQESTASQGLMAWFDAVVIDADTGAPVAPPLHVEAAHLRFSLQPRAAVADDGVMIVLLPGDEDAGTDDRWSVRAPDGAELHAFPPTPDTEVDEVFAWDGGWLFQTRTDLVSLTRDGLFRSSVPLPIERALVVVAGDGIFMLGGHAGESSSDVLYPSTYCIERRDVTLQLLESHCLDPAALSASFVDD